jgi:hypothetical protein
MVVTSTSVVVLHVVLMLGISLTSSHLAIGRGVTEAAGLREQVL